MPATLPPWLQASNAPATYAAMLPQGAKLGMQANEFAQEMALKRASENNQMLTRGATLGLQAGEQAQSMALNTAKLQYEREQEARSLQLQWQKEMDSLAQHAASLDQASYQAELDHAIKQQQLQQESLMNSHRLAVEREYKNQMIGVNRQKLEQASQALQFKTAQAARQLETQQRIKSRIAAQEDPVRVYMEEWGQAGLPGSGLGSVLGAQVRAQTATAPEELEVKTIDLPDGRQATAITSVNPRTGSRQTHVINPQTTRSDPDKAYTYKVMQMKEKQKLEYESQLGDDEKMNKPILAKIEKLNKEIEALGGSVAKRSTAKRPRIISVEQVSQ